MAEFASKGVAGAGLGLGIAGTALGLLNGGAGLLNGMAGMNGCCASGQNAYVSRYEMTMAQELAAKDGKIALLEADKYTDQKLTEVYKDLNGQINNLKQQISQQAVYNATVNGSIACIQKPDCTAAGPDQAGCSQHQRVPWLG